jgi:hypothetical protein
MRALPRRPNPGRPPQAAAGHELQIPDVLPILPMRNLVMSPGAVASLSIGRPAALQLCQQAPPPQQSRGPAGATKGDGRRKAEVR